MRIEVYLDNQTSPIEVLTPPEKFNLDTTSIADGKHEITFKAIDDKAITSVKVIPIIVQNGPEIAVHGLKPDENLSGSVAVLANAYGSSIGDEFEPMRMETPAPVPTWAWVLFLMVLAWGAGYLSIELSERIDTPLIASSSPSNNNPQNTLDESAGASWSALGERVYGNNCSSCHQADGSGLAAVFPPLKGNSVVLADDPAEHILAVLNGVADKVIDGIAYASPMPGFGTQLTDQEVAAVVNHERTQWGNSGVTVNSSDVAKLR